MFKPQAPGGKKGTAMSEWMGMTIRIDERMRVVELLFRIAFQQHVSEYNFAICVPSMSVVQNCRAKPERCSRCGRSLFEPESQDPQVPRHLDGRW
jgi:hypothetical protein